MLLSGSIQSDKHNGAVENVRSIRINRYKEYFLHLYGFMLLSGSIESDKHNAVIEKCEKRSDK